MFIYYYLQKSYKIMIVIKVFSGYPSVYIKYNFAIQEKNLKLCLYIL